MIQDQLRRIGVAMAITELDFTTTLERAADGRHDAWFGSYVSDPSPASIAEVWTSSGIGSFNYGHYTNPAVERLVNEALNAGSLSHARALWHQVITAINADAPAVFVYVPVMMAGIHTRLDNVTLRPDQRAATLWTWRVNPARRIHRDRFGVD